MFYANRSNGNICNKMARISKASGILFVNLIAMLDGQKLEQLLLSFI